MTLPVMAENGKRMALLIPDRSGKMCRRPAGCQSKTRNSEMRRVLGIFLIMDTGVLPTFLHSVVNEEVSSPNTHPGEKLGLKDCKGNSHAHVSLLPPINKTRRSGGFCSIKFLFHSFFPPPDQSPAQTLRCASQSHIFLSSPTHHGTPPP